LVIGGGGATDNACLIGVITGLFDAGLDVTQAYLIIGTSAGSTAAAQLTSLFRQICLPLSSLPHLSHRLNWPDLTANLSRLGVRRTTWRHRRSRHFLILQIWVKERGYLWLKTDYEILKSILCTVDRFVTAPVPSIYSFIAISSVIDIKWFV